MRFLKKYYKLIGTIVTVIALVFVVKKIVTMDVRLVDVCVGQADCNDYRLCADTDGCDSVYVHALGAVRPHPVRDKYSHERCTAGVYQVESDEICAGQCFSVCGRNQLAADLHISRVT